MPKYNPIAIEVKIALSPADVALVMQSSLERVLNNAIDCGNEFADFFRQRTGYIDLTDDNDWVTDACFIRPEVK